MIKSCFSLVGLTVIAILGLALLVGFLNLTQGVPLPEIKIPTTLALPNLDEITISSDPAQVRIEARSPLDSLPTRTAVPPTPTPQPTPTPIPPLPPEIYRAEVLVRLRTFAAALDVWMAANDRLAGDTTLLDDAGWQTEMRTSLANVASTGRSLDEVGPPPPEYQAIDDWLAWTGAEAAALEQSYLAAINVRTTESFTLAAENFNRIRQYLSEAVQEMLAAGWPLD
jgi:hypothetical protein